MLRKLMKYEFKSTARTFLPVYGALLASALMTRLLVWGDSSSAALNQTFLYNLFTSLVMVLFSVMLAATFVVTLVVCLQRYSKNLLGEEGYLSMTLPVKPWQHILSKAIVSVFWYFASGVAAVLSFVLLMWNRNIVKQIWSVIKFFFVGIRWDTQTVLFTVELLILILIGSFCSVLLLYASLSLGQLSQRSRKMASFGYFLALSLGSELAVGIASRFIEGFLPFHSANRIHGLLWYCIILTALIAAAYFFISNYMLSRKLNLE